MREGLCGATGGDPSLINTANAVESVNARLRQIIKTRGHFPTDDAPSKLIRLAWRTITAGWTPIGRPRLGGVGVVPNRVKSRGRAADFTRLAIR